MPTGVRRLALGDVARTRRAEFTRSTVGVRAAAVVRRVALEALDAARVAVDMTGAAPGDRALGHPTVAAGADHGLMHQGEAQRQPSVGGPLENSGSCGQT